MSTLFPFTAVVGQSQMKLALLLCAIDPKIGGALLSGGRGSAKSTLVRSLTDLLPEKSLVTIPLGATEEMITGSIQLDKALRQGEIAFNPGILARAHQGLLYVDEVNLLPDHLVDLLLDVASSNVNLVERDGMSHSHPADFVLIGTMNPDEGELRPQLLDRFGLMAPVQSQFNRDERQQIVEQRMAFDADPVKVLQAHSDAMRGLKEQIENAITLLPTLRIPATVKSYIAVCCEEAEVEGLRADITMYRAVIAHAALEGHLEATIEDVTAVSELVLAHRRTAKQRPPFNIPEQSPTSGNTPQSDPQGGSAGESSIQGSWGAMAPQIVSSAEPVSLDMALTPSGHPHHFQSSERSDSRQSGAFVGQKSFSRKSVQGKPDWFRTLIAPENRKNRTCDQSALQLHRRQPQRQALELDLILLDTSASTLAGGGLSQAKGVIRSLSYEAYLQRRQLAILSFGNDTVSTVLHPQRAPKDIEPLLQSISGGGGTPLAQALQAVENLLTKKQRGSVHCALFILTDGRTAPDQHLPDQLHQLCNVSIIDIEASRIKLGLGKKLAEKLGGNYVNASTHIATIR